MTDLSWAAQCELRELLEPRGTDLLFAGFERSGTLGDLIAFVLDQPTERQDYFAIVCAGTSFVGIDQIRNLARRPDYPHSR